MLIRIFAIQEKNLSKKPGQIIKTVCILVRAAIALVSSGFPASKFVRFSTKKKSDREKILIEISENQKILFYTNSTRINRLLKELKEFCGGSREIQIARELTKKFEEIIGPDIDSVINIFKTKDVVGEFTIIIKGKAEGENDEFNKIKVKKDLQELIKAGLSLSAASKYLAKKLNLSKNLIYNLY